jgi:hypothetical protein
MHQHNVTIKPRVKKGIAVEKFLMDVQADNPTAQIFRMKMHTVMQMLMHYYPVSTKKLMQKAVKKAQADHRLEMDKDYCATFIQNV